MAAVVAQRHSPCRRIDGAGWGWHWWGASVQGVLCAEICAQRRQAAESVDIVTYTMHIQQRCIGEQRAVAPAGRPWRPGRALAAQPPSPPCRRSFCGVGKASFCSKLLPRCASIKSLKHGLFPLLGGVLPPSHQPPLPPGRQRNGQRGACIKRQVRNGTSVLRACLCIGRPGSRWPMRALLQILQKFRAHFAVSASTQQPLISTSLQIRVSRPMCGYKAFPSPGLATHHQ